MDIKTLESFKLSDAVKFHDELNPRLWKDDHLDPLVKKQLLVIAEDFVDELGINNLDVEDITISGSNAAYSFTPHSDLDLHIIVDMSKLPDDTVYRELFDAKKTLYNQSHDITVHGVPVELYVQDSQQPVVSLGEYSILNDKWIKIPKKQRANFDQTATKEKFEQLARIIKVAVKSKDGDKINKAIKKIKQYRKAGLDKYGEFGPENLAYKALRTQKLIDALYDARDKAHSEKLSIEEESKLLDKPTPTVDELAKKYKVDRMEVAKQLDKGIKVELEHTKKYTVAREIALDHLGENLKYYEKLAKAELEEGASGYIPSNAEKIPASLFANPSKTFSNINEKISYIVKKQDLDWNTKLQLIDTMSATNVITENIDSPLKEQIQSMIKSFNSKSIQIGKRYIPVLIVLSNNKPMFFDIEQNCPAKQLARFGTLLAFSQDQYTLKIAKKTLSYPNNIQREISFTSTMLIDNPQTYDKLRTYVSLVFDVSLPELQSLKEGASGYIPSNAEKNNPRYKTAFKIDEIGFSNEVGPLSMSDEQIIDNSAKDGTIGSRPVFLFVSGPNSIYFFANKSKIDALLYIHNGYLKGMKNFSKNKGLVYNLFQYLINIKKQKLHLASNDILTSDGIKWILDQLRRKETGFKIADQGGNEIDPNTLFAEWENARETGKPGPTAITIGESKNSTQIRENEKLLMPMDIYGATLTEVIPHKHSVVEVPDLIEASGYIPSNAEKNDPRFKSALTVDIKPDTMKKNAAKFGNKITRAGIPPQARADGKIK